MPSPFTGHNWLVDEIHTILPNFEASLTVNNVYGMLRSVQNGIGIATLPSFLSDQQENLVRILDRLEIPSADAYFVYPSELKDSRRITVFRDFLLQKVSQTSF